jgi:hypothetical protein
MLVEEGVVGEATRLEGIEEAEDSANRERT